MAFFLALAEYSFLQSATIAGLLASIGCGVIGSYVVVKRITFLAGGIAHTVLGGMGAAIYFGFNPLAGALIAAIIAALIIGCIRILWNDQEDTMIGALWAIGMATGILFITATEGYQSDLMTYLFGNILLASHQSLWFMLALDAVILLAVTTWHRQFLVVLLDPEFASLRNIPVNFFYLLLLVLIAVTVVLLIQIVGLMLVLALLTLPAAIAGHYCKSLGRRMLIATILGIFITLSGLALSYDANLPAGSTIVIIAGIIYSASVIFNRWLTRQSKTAQG